MSWVRTAARSRQPMISRVDGTDPPCTSRNTVSVARYVPTSTSGRSTQSWSRASRTRCADSMPSSTAPLCSNATRAAVAPKSGSAVSVWWSRGGKTASIDRSVSWWIVSMTEVTRIERTVAWTKTTKTNTLTRTRTKAKPATATTTPDATRAGGPGGNCPAGVPDPSPSSQGFLPSAEGAVTVMGGVRIDPAGPAQPVEAKHGEEEYGEHAGTDKRGGILGEHPSL